MSAENSAPQGGSIRYHYVITLQSEALNGVQISFEHGVITGGPGEARADLFRQILRNAERLVGPNPVPLFFSLEPDELEEA